ncbi:MAG: PEP/pyruvate-binding domain-containing protein, partial [Calditrichota bacterium]
DHLDYIRIAKNFVEIEDFAELIQRMIYPRGSHGLLGGKSAGLFLAYQVIRRKCAEYPELKDIKIPRTWYITSDGLHSFMDQNNLEEVTEQKYKDIELVRQEYPHIIQLFKNSQFNPEIIQGLSQALDELGDKPIIVRSSSLLEDRFGATFSGKYKSLFLANQGAKEQRLEALMDAIAEVYSSTFGSDPIEYRSERDLIDFYEEMGIIVQEVVGTRVGDYFMPAFAGVAFSNNEFRWSPRIKRDDGLIRLVPGLGTRAVDRLSDDYPILVAPGQPGLRVNISVDEIIRYSPNKMDVINLKSNSFETVDVLSIFREYGEEFPLFDKIISVIIQDHIKSPQWDLDLENDQVAVTFEGLMTGTAFIQQVNTLLKVLQDTLDSPVDIEFAHDGTNFFLLQCRPQSFSADSAPAVIPKDIPETAMVFTARKHISNGWVPDITHIVYVDSVQYNEITDLNTMVEVGRVVSRLNQALPRRQFILMGPGRWGSRGDIKLGVQVTYSDINNTAVLIEIARQKGNYVPDLSFGTHFFQDLVEASIRYLPLYPDEKDIIFNERFLLGSPSILAFLLPEYEYLENVVRVIDVMSATGGKVLKIFMNAELDEAVGLLSQPSGRQEVMVRKSAPLRSPTYEDHWRWRYRMVEHIADNLDPDRFGVQALYLFGSAKNATAHPGSDIDLLIHFRGDKNQMTELLAWLEGWSLSLDEMNYLRTGYRTGGLLDVHIITDEDISQRTSYAAKIGAVTDPVLEIPIKRSVLKMNMDI